MNFEQASETANDGVVVVIGAILLISIAVLALSAYQTQTVPVVEEKKEIEHSRLTTQQMLGIREAIIASSSQGTLRSAEIKPGVDFGSPASPFVYSPPSVGTVSANPYDGNVTIANVSARGEPGEYWNGKNVTYTRNSYFSYIPDYQHFNDAPAQYVEYGIYYKDYNKTTELDRQVRLSNQPLINGKSINLVMMSGDFTESRLGTVSVQSNPVSASEKTIAVSANSSSEPITFYLPTRLSAEDWRNTILKGEICQDDNNDFVCDSSNPDGHVVKISPASNDRIKIVLEINQTYRMKLSKVFLTTQQSATRNPDTKAVYAVLDGESVTIREDSEFPVDAFAYDRYNNPVGGATVVGEAIDTNTGNTYPDNCFGGYRNTPDSPQFVCKNGAGAGTYTQRGIDTTDIDGESVFVYQAPPVEGDENVQLRVCLRRYITNGPANHCGQVDNTVRNRTGP